ncbi:oxidoreductase [Vibrio fluvialis]|uniref:oxidoreductase n=1 Tax=Vibrio fluvialis TaxID=676 RepID=UPI000CEB76E1|nr:oxidoreductase [Vibrio fluvialis]AVH33375.1 oxidoreductase [Vibrio fluvialis]ELI5731470.1 oxidoreductase [Vibrio fluvialis]TOY94827.1 oxidoreductase [Vibrio fluvialis]TRN14394.1 oxidoreductase [Vibrio fluvialis]
MMRRLSIIWLLLFSLHAVAADLTIKVGEQASQTLSLDQLQTVLPVNAFTTKLPWLPEPHTYTGFTITDLLDYLKISHATSVSLIALNDYVAKIEMADLRQYQPIVAYFMDGKPMRVRDKGPFWLVYDLTTHPEIDEPMHYTLMVWQIKEIQIHTR